MKAEIQDPDRPAVQAEITVTDPDELVITVTGDSPLAPGEIADAFLAMVSEPPAPRDPKTVRVVRVRLVRYEVTETLVALPAETQVWT